MHTCQQGVFHTIALPCLVLSINIMKKFDITLLKFIFFHVIDVQSIILLAMDEYLCKIKLYIFIQVRCVKSDLTFVKV
jgi:hypothetical protein